MFFRKLHLLSVLVLVSMTCVSQDYPGARAAGVSGAGLTFSDPWAVYYNQGALARVRTFSAGVSYQSRFMVKELGDKFFAAVVPVRKGSFGISYRSFGYSAFTRSKTGVAYSLPLSAKFYAGVQASYHYLRIAEEYGSRQAFTAEVGFLYLWNEKFSLAGHLSNPTRSRLIDYNDERLPVKFSLGAEYRFASYVRMVMSVNKIVDKKTDVAAGLEYAVREKLFFRAGASTQPGLFSFGLGYKYNSIQVDVASTYHSVLGFSPQISLVFMPGSEK